MEILDLLAVFGIPVVLLVGVKYLVTRVAKAKGTKAAGWAGAIPVFLFTTFLLVFSYINLLEAEKQTVLAQEASLQAQENANEADKQRLFTEKIQTELQTKLENCK